MGVIFAIFSHPENGYSHDQEKTKQLNKGETYILENAEVGRFHTNIRLKGYSGTFNSVNFEFCDESGHPVNIYEMPEFSSYLKYE